MLQLADKLKSLREKENQLKDELKDIRSQIKDTTSELTSQMLTNELQSFNRNGSMFYLATQTYINSVASKREKLHEVLRREGFGDIVKEAVHPQTLRAFVREQIAENNDELPEWLDGLVSVYEEDQVRVRKSS